MIHLPSRGGYGLARGSRGLYRDVRFPLVILLATLALPARPDTGPASLQVDWTLDGAITGSALVLTGVGEVASGSLAPSTCRWCSTTGMDASVRERLAWSHRHLAAGLSDALLLSMPAGIAAYDFFATRAAGGGLKQTAEDLLVIAEAVAVTGVANEIAKYTAARQRPLALHGEGTGGRDDHLSFFSSHASAAFALAAAAGSVAQARGYQAWPWVYGIGFTAAATTSYLRMAADQHWLTDILAGAAVGTAVGFGVPWLHRGGAAEHVQVLPTPGGLVIAARFQM